MGQVFSGRGIDPVNVKVKTVVSKRSEPRTSVYVLNFLGFVNYSS